MNRPAAMEGRFGFVIVPKDFTSGHDPCQTANGGGWTSEISPTQAMFFCWILISPLTDVYSRTGATTNCLSLTNVNKALSGPLSRPSEERRAWINKQCICGKWEEVMAFIHSNIRNSQLERR